MHGKIVSGLIHIGEKTFGGGRAVLLEHDIPKNLDKILAKILTNH